MSKTAFIRARIEPNLKAKVEHILQKSGVSTSQIINMLYCRIDDEGKLPAELFIPNARTARAIREARAGKDVVKCKDSKDLFN